MRILVSGNVTITVIGNNFDISNSSLVTIELADTPCIVSR